MPLPLAPLAGVAVKYGAVALAAWAAGEGLRRALRPGRIDQRAEDALDDTDEGIALHRPRDRDQANASARMCRTLRLGNRAWRIDAAALARIRIRKV
ncbi:MAG: hypothetical protein WCZ72_11120 [Gemmobacter sp.]